MVQVVAAIAIFAGCVTPSLIEGGDALSDGRKADWKSAAARLDRKYPGVPVVVIAPSPGPNLEVEVARFYLGDRRTVIPRCQDASSMTSSPLLGPRPGRVFFSASLRNHTPRG